MTWTAVPDAHTVRFGLDGHAYEIDLTDAHAGQFRDVQAPYMSAGRRLTSSGRPHVRIDLDTKNHRGRDGAAAVGATDQLDGTTRSSTDDSASGLGEEPVVRR